MRISGYSAGVKVPELFELSLVGDQVVGQVAAIDDVLLIQLLQLEAGTVGLLVLNRCSRYGHEWSSV